MDQDLKAILAGQCTDGDFIFEGNLVFQNEDVKELYEEHLATLNQEPADK